VSQPNSEMVARLREMIDGEQYQESGDRAALRAGAEALEKLPLAQEQAAKVWGLACERDELKLSRDKALEAVEVAKAALAEAKACIWDSHYGGGLSVPYAREVSVKIDAALARLEGK
jgi:hypothetical protein